MQDKPEQKLSEQELLSKALQQHYRALYAILIVILVAACAILTYSFFGDTINLASLRRPKLEGQPIATTQSKTDQLATTAEEIKDGIHVETGLVFAEGFDVVRATCTACHSAKLITQNRATREGWKDIIHWMQETQGLWDLGKQEGVILDYLAAYYAPEEIGRRANLEAIEWYILE